jgi:hypothetical protein
VTKGWLTQLLWRYLIGSRAGLCFAPWWQNTIKPL